MRELTARVRAAVRHAKAPVRPEKAPVEIGEISLIRRNAWRPRAAGNCTSRARSSTFSTA